MAVVELTIHHEADPNGGALATITDDDLDATKGEGFSLRDAENELGAGKISIRRSHAAVGYLVGGNYVKVRIPIIQTEPVFGFWLSQADDTIVGANEESDEILVRGGAGALGVLGRAMLLEQRYSTAHAFRGGTNVDGFWTWTSEPYGAILVRLIEEGQLEPGSPLADVTIDFNRQEDSNGDPWPDIVESIQVDIGTDGLGLYERLVATGNLYVYARPNLLIQAYGSPPGVNRTSATFASGKVRFEKGVNIETELVRTDEGRPATHALVKGKGLVYRQVVSPSFTIGDRAKWVTVDFPESDDPDLLDAVGARELARQQLISDQPEFAILPGDDEALGRYLPYKHFAVGDLATLHTGSAAADFDELATRIIAVKIQLAQATDDATDELEQRSLEIALETNGGPTYGGLARRDPGVNVPNGCAPCPGDFPFVPWECDPTDFTVLNNVDGGELFTVFPPGWATDGIDSSHNSPPTFVHLYEGATYRLRYTAMWGPDADDLACYLEYAGGPPLGTLDMGKQANPPPPMTPLGEVEVTVPGTATNDYYLHLDHLGTVANNPIGSEASVEVIYVSGPDPRFEDLPPCTNGEAPGTPPSAGQMTPPAAPLETPDGTNTVFTVPFTPARYAPGSLHVEFNGSRLERGVDFEETDPAAGTFTFLTFTPSANAQIVVWYQQGTP